MYSRGLKSTRTERRSESRIRRSVSQVTSVPLAGANARVRRRYNPLEKQFLARKTSNYWRGWIGRQAKTVSQKKIPANFYFYFTQFHKKHTKTTKIKKTKLPTKTQN
jgi:hypothetical protein